MLKLSCEPCIDEWRKASLRAKLQTPQSAFAPGKMVETECPECRGDAKGRIKIYILEELVRVMSRYDPTAHFQVEEDGEKR
jgi:hypothetical protein